MNFVSFNNIKNILFNNVTLRQTIFKNTFWLAAEMTISRILKLVLVIYVARILGATEYGKFTFALAFVSLFLVFSNLGLSTIVTREFARDKTKEKEFYSIISLKILLSLGSLIFMLIGSFFVASDEAIRKVIWILAVYVLVNGFYTIIYSFFYARQRMEYEALGEILNALAIIGLGLFVIFNFPSIINLSYAYLISSTIVLIFILIIFHLKFLPLKLSFEKRIWKKFLSLSWPLALASLFSTLYINIDSVMMGYSNQITETGWYNASYRIIYIVLLPMGLIAGSFFPVFSKFARPAKDAVAEKVQEMKENLQKIWDYNLKVMILLAFPLMVGGIVLASKIIDLIYGHDFLPSILAFQILIIMAGICFLYRPFLEVLIASDRQKKVFWVVFAGAIINIFLNSILIPKYSLYGAAVATVVTHFLMSILFFNLTSKHTLIKPLNLKFVFYLIIAIFSSFLMYLIISRPQIYNFNIFLVISIGALVYLISFFAMEKTLGFIKIN